MSSFGSGRGLGGQTMPCLSRRFLNVLRVGAVTTCKHIKHEMYHYNLRLKVMQCMPCQNKKLSPVRSIGVMFKFQGFIISRTHRHIYKMCLMGHEYTMKLNYISNKNIVINE